MERNKIKITYNPYKKEIFYRYWDSTGGSWEEVDINSPLLQAQCSSKDVTIQNNSYNIVETINDNYNVGNIGIDIVFEGTKDDFDTLNYVAGRYFLDFDIKCIKGSKSIISPLEAKDKIEDCFKRLNGFLRDYGDTPEIVNELNRYLDAVKTTVPVCVMGLYSSGKSAFINSLIGKEILPSDSDPTTARNYRITKNDLFGKIKFRYENEQIELKFTDNSSEITLGNFNPFVEGIIDSQLKIAEIEPDISLPHRMHYALEVINNSPDTRISDLIEIEVPFAPSYLKSASFDFVIYDTPGSNSATNRDHFAKLKEALGKQTNGLPIFVTTSDTMDSTDNYDLIKEIKKLDNSLDLTNTMIIVNKSDMSDIESLEKKSRKTDSSIVSKWRSSSIYFLSSIVGLGSKKTDKKKWINSYYRKTFKRASDSFLDMHDDDYMQLYKINVMPKGRKDHYNTIAENAVTESDLLYHNSGLACVENEIIAFAEKSSMYNKCVNAREYLKNAIELTDKSIEKSNKKLGDVQLEIKNAMDTKKQQLVDEIDSRIKTCIDYYTSDYIQKMNRFVNESSYSSFLRKDEIENEWNVFKKEKKDRINRTVDRITQLLKYKTAAFLSDFSNESCEYWKKKEEAILNECYIKVMNNSFLTETERDKISGYIRSFDVIDFPMNVTIDPIKVRKPAFLWFGSQLDIDKLEKECTSAVSDYIREYTERVVKSHKKQLNLWCSQFKTGFYKEISRLNPELMDYSRRLESIETEINRLQQQTLVLKKCSEEVNDIFLFR